MARVRLTAFWERMREQFGEAYAASVAQDYVIGALGGRTVNQALADGEDAKVVWRAVCDAFHAPGTLSTDGAAWPRAPPPALSGRRRPYFGRTPACRLMIEQLFVKWGAPAAVSAPGPECAGSGTCGVPAHRVQGAEARQRGTVGGCA